MPFVITTESVALLYNAPENVPSILFSVDPPFNFVIVKEALDFGYEADTLYCLGETPSLKNVIPWPGVGIIG